MTLTVKHAFVSPVPDDNTPNEVGPDDWNADHELSGQLSTLQIENGAVTNEKLAPMSGNSIKGNALNTDGSAADLISTSLTYIQASSNDEFIGWTAAGLLRKFRISDITFTIGPGDVGTNELADGAVTEPKLGLGAVTEGKIGTGAVTATKIGAGAVGSTKIANGAVGSLQLANNAVTNEKLGTDSISNGKIQNNAIDQNNLQDNSVGTAELINGNVTHAKLATNAVENDNIANLAVDTAELADGAVTAAKLAAGAIDENSLADDSVTGGPLGPGVKIKQGTITSDNMALNSVDANALANNAVDEAAIQNGAVTENKLGTDAVTAGKIATNAVGASELADNAVDRAAIQADAVDDTKIADNAIGNEHLQNNAVDSAEIANGAVTEGKIGTGAVTSGKIGTDAVTEVKILNGSVSTNKLANDAVDNTKLNDMAEGTIKGALTAGNPVDFGRGSFTPITTPAGTEYMLGWNAANQLVAIEASKFTAQGLDPTVNEEITGVWKFTNGMTAQLIGGVPYDGAGGDTVTGMSADHVVLNALQSLLVGAPGMVDHANVVLGVVNPDNGLAELQFVPQIPAYEDNIQRTSDIALDTIGVSIFPTNLTLTEDLPAGSVVSIVTDLEVTSRDDTYSLNVLVNGSQEIEMLSGVVTLADGVKTIVGSVTITGAGLSTNDTLNVIGRHNVTQGGNTMWVRADNVGNFTELSVYKPASGGGGGVQDVVNAANPSGGGVGLVQGVSSGVATIKTLFSGNNSVTFTPIGQDEIDVRATSDTVGADNFGVNLSPSTPYDGDIYAGMSGGGTGDGLQFKGLNVSGTLTRSATGNEITFGIDDSGYGKLASSQTWGGSNEFSQNIDLPDQSITPPTIDQAISKRHFDNNKGESNTAANLPGGDGNVFATKSGSTLNLRSLVGGTNINISQDTNNITVNWSAPSNIVYDNTAETISATWSFSVSPTVPTPTGGTDAANKTYVDGKVDKGGDTMTGNLNLPVNASPAAAMAVRKDWIESNFSNNQGDVVGPALSVNDDIAIFDGTTGKLIKDSGAKVTDFATNGDIADMVTNAGAGTLNNIVLFDTTSKTIKDSGKAVTDFVEDADIADKVDGPATATIGNIAQFSATDGKTIADSGKSVSDFLESSDIANLVTGPISATNLNIAVFDGTTGKIIQDGGVAISGLATSGDLANYLPLAGGTMAGDITRAADPTNNNHLARKLYVDNQRDTRVAKAGDTMSGALTLPGDPTANLHAATKQYVDGHVPKGSDNENANVAISVVATLPGTPDANTLYFVTTAP